MRLFCLKCDEHDHGHDDDDNYDTDDADDVVRCDDDDDCDDEDDDVGCDGVHWRSLSNLWLLSPIQSLLTENLAKELDI